MAFVHHEGNDLVGREGTDLPSGEVGGFVHREGAM
jgi:hypothetical protein